jgi:hypothetical protein
MESERNFMTPLCAGSLHVGVIPPMLHTHISPTLVVLVVDIAINLLKPSGNLTYDQFNIKKFYVVPTLRLCVLYGSQNKQQLLPYKTLRDWFL